MKFSQIVKHILHSDKLRRNNFGFMRKENVVLKSHGKTMKTFSSEINFHSQINDNETIKKENCGSCVLYYYTMSFILIFLS